MQFLLLNQFFHPDSAATSQLLTDLARSLAATGHTVRAICGRSSYAQGDRLEPPPVDIVRCPGLRFARGPLARPLSYASFLSGAFAHALLGPKPDLVLTLTTPPVLSLLGALLKHTSGARHFIWEMDLYPDIAIDLGVLRARSPFTRALGASLDRARRRADGIIALGECMRQRLLNHGIPAGRIHVAENWADGSEIRPRRFPPPRPLTILYSGNLGLAHDVATIRGAMLELARSPRFHFRFAGGGPRRPALDEFCRRQNIGNVSFGPYCSRGDLGAHLGEGHIGLVTQKPETLGSVVPSKIYGILAAGRPVLYIGPREATPARIIRRHRCGWQIDPGDTPTLLALLEHLAANPNLIEDTGARAREVFHRHYDRPIAMARLCDILGVPRSEQQPVGSPEPPVPAFDM